MTQIFESLFKVLIKGKGMSDLPYVVFPYPLEPLPEEEIRRLTRERLSQVVAGLTR